MFLKLKGMVICFCELPNQLKENKKNRKGAKDSGGKREGLLPATSRYR